MVLKKSSSNILLDEREIEDSTLSLSAFFRKKGKELQEKIGEGFRSLYPQEKLAERLNISIDQFRQKIYGKKPLSRDWLIAICAVYGLDEFDTSEALRISNMPTLDDASKRESFIVEFLNEHKGQSVSVNDFNFALESAGLPPLSINYRSRKRTAQLGSNSKCPYNEYRPRMVRVYGDEGDSYDSLAIKYLPNKRCVASAFVEDNTKKKILLEAFSDGTFHITYESDTLPTVYQSNEPTNPYFGIFSELAVLVRKEKQRLDDVVNDTKNYRGRFAANIKNDRIHVFYEEFNYSMPEHNEYLMMEYIEGNYILSIANQSMFLQQYLPVEDYRLHYHVGEIISRRSYASIEDIDEYCSQATRGRFYPDLMQNRKNAYKRLKRIVEEKLQALLQHKLFIQNFDYIWDNPYDVLRFYGIEAEFKCSYGEEYGDIISAQDFAIIIDDEGNKVPMSFDEIKLAFEFGINNIADICRIKRTYGTIEYILT